MEPGQPLGRQLHAREATDAIKDEIAARELNQR